MLIGPAEFTDKLRASLEGHLQDPQVRVIADDSIAMRGIIVSPTFEGMDEGEQQAIVWGRVLDTFDVGERRQIEFLYTDAPSEVDPGSVSGARRG